MARTQQTYRCSFCGKSKEQVARLIAGPGGIYICDECVALCGEIIVTEQHATTPSPSAPALPDSSPPREPVTPDFGERVFDALLALDYHIEIADDGRILARCESATLPAAPRQVAGQIAPDGTLTWPDHDIARQTVFAARIVALRNRIR